MKKNRINSHIRPLAGVFILGFGLGLMAWSTQAQETITLLPHTSHDLQFEAGIQEVHISRSGVIATHESEDTTRIKIMALAPGRSELSLVTNDGESFKTMIHVENNMRDLVSALGRIGRRIEGLVITNEGNNIIFDGEIEVLDHWHHKENLKDRFPGLVLDYTKRSPNIGHFLIGLISEKIGNPDVRVNLIQDSVILEGAVNEAKEAARAHTIASQYAVNGVQNLLSIRQINIEIDARIIRMDESTSRDLGDNPLSTAAGGASGSFSGGNGRSPSRSFTINGGLLFAINALVNKGEARLVWSDYVVTENGKEGRAGTQREEIFQLIGSDVVGLESVTTGLQLNVTPRITEKVDGVHSINLDLNLTGSTPAPANVGIMSTRSFFTETTVTVKEGESLIVSGLSRMFESDLEEKTPLLGSIPILNLFFKRSAKTKTKQEYVLVLTPKASTSLPDTAPSLSTQQVELLR